MAYHQPPEDQKTNFWLLINFYQKNININK